MADKQFNIKVQFDFGRASTETKKAAQSAKYAAGSFGDLEQKVKLANEAFKNTVPGTQAAKEAFDRLRIAQQNLAAASLRAMVLNQESSRRMASMTTTLQALNFTIRDSPYFFRDFQLGILAVGNNLNPLIDGLIRLKGEARAAGTTLGALFKNALTGPQGWVFLFSAAVSILQAVTFAMEGTKNSADDTAESFENLVKRVKELNVTMDEFSQFGVVSLEKMREELDDASESVVKRFFILFNLFKQFGGGAFYDKFKILLEGFINRADLRIESLQNLIDFYNRNANTINSLVNTAVTGDVTALEKYIQTQELTGETILFTIKQLDEAKNSLKVGSQALRENRTAVKALREAYKRLFDLQKQNKDTFENFGVLKDLYAELKRLEGLKPFQNTIEDAKQLQSQINATKQQIQELEILIGLREAPKTKQYTGYGFLKPLIDELNELKKLRPLADTFEEAVALEKQIESLQIRIKTRQDAIKRAASGEQLEPINLGENIVEPTEQASEQLAEFREGLSKSARIATRLGNALFNAFIHGKQGLDDFLKSLAIAVAQFVFIEGLKYLFSGGAAGVFGSPVKSVVPAPSVPQSVGAPQSITVINDINSLRKAIEAQTRTIASLENQVIIYADTDAVKFTKSQVKPAENKLLKQGYRKNDFAG